MDTHHFAGSRKQFNSRAQEGETHVDRRRRDVARGRVPDRVPGRGLRGARGGERARSGVDVLHAIFDRLAASLHAALTALRKAVEVLG